MSKNLIVGLVVLVVVAGAAFVAVGSKNGDKKDDGAASTNMSQQDTAKSQAAEDASANQPAASQASQTDAVTIKDMAFAPATIKVKAGTTVTWTNQDSVEHNVVADNPSADAPNGPLLPKGESYKFTFNKAGTYTYHCQPHPFMQGTVIVE